MNVRTNDKFKVCCHTWMWHMQIFWCKTFVWFLHIFHVWSCENKLCNLRGWTWPQKFLVVNDMFTCLHDDMLQKMNVRQFFSCATRHNPTQQCDTASPAPASSPPPKNDAVRLLKLLWARCKSRCPRPEQFSGPWRYARQRVRLDRTTRNFFQVHHFFTMFFCFAEPCGGSCTRLQIEFWCEWTNFRKLSHKPSLFHQHCKYVGKSWRFLGDFARSIAMQGFHSFVLAHLLCGSLRTFVHSLLNWISMRMNEPPIEHEPSRPLTIFFSILCQKW